jgi:MFS family permease
MLQLHLTFLNMPANRAERSSMQVEASRTGKYVVLTVMTIATFLIPLMSSAVNVALPKIGEQFRLDVITLGWVSTAYMLASASLLVPFGKIADMYGRRRTFISGMCVFLVGSVLSAASVTYQSSAVTNYSQAGH